mmetsp:Transcript_26870/g.30753  ORF Transcript_26870/g.30753 Transcript_26870/m.30753 type:complete len:108 (-) Transcript_26870:129-452(-)
MVQVAVKLSLYLSKIGITRLCWTNKARTRMVRSLDWFGVLMHSRLLRVMKRTVPSTSGIFRKAKFLLWNIDRRMIEETWTNKWKLIHVETYYHYSVLYVANLSRMTG